jgi:serine/threonine-protein kinase
VIGEIVGSHRVVAEVGAGGMGAVWLGEHTMLGSRVAIKVLRPEFSQQKAIVDRFFDEARAATRITDPGIVTVFDFGWHHDGSAFLVMELLAGETLGRRIKRLGALAPASALELLRRCAATMAAAHERGIVHRDLKPDNIFIVPDLADGERVKILDFGIAKLLGEGMASHEKTQTGVIMGTPGYMSPEQCRGAGVDHRTDIYALGCVVFHMLCGRPPFVASTPADLIALHLTQAPPSPRSLVTGIGERLEALVLDCLAKTTDRRIPTMRELVARIDDVMTSESLSTSSPVGAHRGSGPLEETPPATQLPSPSAVAAQVAPAPGRAPVAAQRRSAEPVPETVAPTATTSLSSELAAVRPRRTGAILLALGVVAAAAVVAIVVATRKSDEPRAATTQPDPPPATAPGPASGGSAVPDEPIAHEAQAVRDVTPLVAEPARVSEPARVPPEPPVIRRPPERPPVVARPPDRPGSAAVARPPDPPSGSATVARPPEPGSAKPPAGSAKPPAGSADPYADR